MLSFSVLVREKEQFLEECWIDSKNNYYFEEHDIENFCVYLQQMTSLVSSKV